MSRKMVRNTKQNTCPYCKQELQLKYIIYFTVFKEKPLNFYISVVTIDKQDNNIEKIEHIKIKCTKILSEYIEEYYKEMEEAHEHIPNFKTLVHFLYI